MSLFFSPFFHSCETECCGCGEEMDTTKGNFELIMDWRKLWTGIEKPKNVDVYFQHASAAPFSQTIWSDTSYFDLSSGEYHIIACNTSGNLTYSGMENHYTACVHLPVRVTDSICQTIEAPLNLASHITAYIPPSGKATNTIAPTPVIKIINFTFRVTKAESVGEISALKCNLSGVQTSAMLGIDQPVYSHAEVPFWAAQKERNIYTKQLSILGFAYGAMNILHVGMESENGVASEFHCDLSGLIDFSLSPIQNCTIDITIDADTLTSETEIKISAWEEGGEENIHLK
jgi:hypothetical protein